MCLGTFNPYALLFITKTPQNALPCAETRVLSLRWSWSVLRCDLDATIQIQWVSRWHCALYKLNLLKFIYLREEYKKERTKSKPKFAIFVDPLPVVPHQPNFARRVVSSDIFLGFELQKDRLKMWEQWGSNFWFSHWLGTSLIQQLVAIAQAVTIAYLTEPMFTLISQ